MELPSLPTDFANVLSYLNKSKSRADLTEKIKPFKEYEAKLREIFAQQPDHGAIKQNHLVSVFQGERLSIKARDLDGESDKDKEKYLLPLPDSDRRKNGSPATVANIKDFKTNFNLFSEQSLTDLDWSNVIAAGSSVVSSLLPIDSPHNESKRALRSYFHEKLAPASDVDLFIYGLNEEQAIEKIKQIEASVRDSVLAETTTIRTKNAITIVSEYPTRHVQIVLRLYKNITEILTGFDVDCSCVAYDGKQVWASPRALAAFATQQNTVDLTRRSPSYENRLSKYSHRGFEVHWPSIDRSRIDPTIFERAFNRVVGLARLLVLEKLPHPSDRDSYAEKRRKERGRPDLPWNARYRHALPGNVKDAQPDDVPEWLEEDEVSQYHTFTIPYGPKYTAKKIEKLLFKKDLLLNAEWNKNKDRETNLHRHPAFFGSVDDVIQDCCGFCPKPVTDEDLKAHEEESKMFISGELHFMKDDPGRQAIGSFHPLTDDDWTDMAYLGSSLRLCQAIVNQDIEAVKDWFGEEGADVNRRDHTGRTPLQIACMCSSPEIVQILIERGARIVSRIYNGMTALHMAAHRGDAKIVKLLLDRSEANEEEENKKEDARKEARRAAIKSDEDTKMDEAEDDDKNGGEDEGGDTDNEDKEDEDDKSNEDEDIEMIDDIEESDHDDDMTEGSFVKVKDSQAEVENEDEPDVYDVDVLAWDSPVSPLHLAIMAGHIEVLNLLVEEYGADALLPVKMKQSYGSPKALLSMVLPIHLASEKANDTIRALLNHGASPAQADSNQITNLHWVVFEAKIRMLDILDEMKGETSRKVVSHLVVNGWYSSPSINSSLLTAIRRGSSDVVRKVLEMGADPVIDFDSFVKAYTNKFEDAETDPDVLKNTHLEAVEQPIIVAAEKHQMVDIVAELIDRGIDVNTLTARAHYDLRNQGTYDPSNDCSLLDLVQTRIKELEKYPGEDEDPPKKPHSLPDLEDPRSGGYQSWVLQTTYAQAQMIHKEQMEKYEEDVKDRGRKETKGTAEKESVIEEMKGKWKELEKKLLAKDAKTFKELHPKHATDESNNQGSYEYKVGQSGSNKNKPFNNRISFQVPDLSDTKREKYIKLFEAVFSGNTEEVKALCLDTNDPLRIAVRDLAGFTPFSLAVLLENYDLARVVLDITAAQYQPPKEEEKTYRYSLHRPETEYEIDDNDDDNVKVYREIVDENYTIDDIRLISNNLKSKTSPTELFNMTCELWRVLPSDIAKAQTAFSPSGPSRYFSPYYDDEKDPWAWFNEMMNNEKWRHSFSLYRYAIVTNNMRMLTFLLGLETDLTYRRDDDEVLQKLQLDEDTFDLAFRSGRTEMISEIIRYTGTLLPLANLVKKSGVQLDEKPKYYQGLSVYGKKRQDWAQQDRGESEKYNADHGSPLLAAILSGNIETVEYFLSETPLRCYEEFTQKFKDDKHITLLAKSEGGIERVLHSWMDTRTNLAIHMAVMADPKISKPVRDFVISRMPQYLNIKSKNGTSPLLLAFQYRYYDVAQELISAGADQNTRNKNQENLLHEIYSNRENLTDPESLQKLISMLDKDTVASLTTQRCSGDGPAAKTPLMQFLDSNNISDAKDMKIIDHMLKLSSEKDLEVMNGAGDFPLHTLVRGIDEGYNQRPALEVVKYIANKRPDLLFKENATGQTPLEIAENIFLRSRLDNIPDIDDKQKSGNLAEISEEEFLDSTWSRADDTFPFTPKPVEELKEIADQNSRPRALVSLLDANETARRLAEQQKRNNEDMKRREARGLVGYTSHRYNEPKQEEDEVTLWTARAENFKNMTAPSDEPVPKMSQMKFGGSTARKSPSVKRKHTNS